MINNQISNKKHITKKGYKNKKIIILVDESGTLPDPKDRVVIIAAVGIELPKKLREIFKKVREKLGEKGKNITEIKFYRTGERTKRLFLKELIQQDISLFILVVKKGNQKIADNPENFALLCGLLLKETQTFYKNRIKEIIFDRHFFRKHDQKLFNTYLKQIIDLKIDIKHLDSQQNPEINAADMVAGSVLWKMTNKNREFYLLIKDSIISEKIIGWKEAKRKFLQKKGSLNRRKRPSKRGLNKDYQKKKKLSRN